MLSNLPSSVRIFFCTVPCDMRRSFDGLEKMVREIVQEKPMSGHLFVFVNKQPCPWRRQIGGNVEPADLGDRLNQDH